MREFYTAVKDDLGEVDESDQIRFLHDGTEVVFNKPSNGQMALMLSMGGRKTGTTEMAGNFIALFIELADKETQRYLQSRLLDRNDTFDLDGPGGIFDIWEGLTEEWSGHPTKQPSDYQPPRRATGRSSTAPSRAKGSTSSRSRSTASSTSSTSGR